MRRPEQRHEETTLEALRQLASDGLRVTWPRGQSGSDRGSSVSEGLPAAKRTVPDRLPRGSGCQQLLGSEWQEALAELDELEKSGLRVTRPC